MTLARRQFLYTTGAAVAASAGAVACDDEAPGPAPAGTPGLPDAGDWEAVRGQFPLSGNFIHMSALLITSHPAHVRDAIEKHRRALDADPVVYLQDNNTELRNAVLSAAGRYLNVARSDIALTDSTTMGIGLVYNGLRLKPGDQILSTEQDYYVTHEALRLAARRTGAEIRTISLYENIGDITAGGIVDRIMQAVVPETRVIALTWVHSNTGLKLPLARISQALAGINADREEADRVLLCVDGVHGFGVEDVELPDLGCDFFVAGCHKWLFGPRGTGIIAARSRAWERLIPTIPSFTDDGAWLAWLQGGNPAGKTTASSMTPGGFKAFEHVWALTQAFEFHEAVGKADIASRTHQLAGQLKEGLAELDHVTLHTPRSPELSAGIVSFDVDGMDPDSAVERLRERRLIASVAPYARRHVRLTPSIRNTPDEIETALREVRSLAG
jgi:isopenicillin-N epimerase